MEGKTPPLFRGIFSNALQECAKTWIALLNPSDRGEDKSRLAEGKKQVATCSDWVYL